jgi:hypothetical protein
MLRFIQSVFGNINFGFHQPEKTVSVMKFGLCNKKALSLNR